MRGFSYCLFPIPFNPPLCYTSNISINQNFLSATTALCPPKPRDDEIATSTSAFTAALGT